jgi:FlaA1/EpsC-like NDP-sugar epimerase
MDPIEQGIEQTPTIDDGFFWIFQFVGEILFQWVPSTIITIAYTGHPPQGVEYYSAPYGPATAHDAIMYVQTASAPGVYETFVRFWSFYTAISLFVSLLLAMVIIYCIIRIEQIRKHERMKVEATAHPVAARDISRTQLRWNRIVEEASSDNEQNWRLAILEADIMLNELLDSLGYKGETMADKMRQVERGDFNTIDIAWEAHRARNAIAHQGLSSPLSPREARRIVGLYERVFREFKFIS